jgi:diaminobutyrate-2-oxoglutarate transaminase
MRFIREHRLAAQARDKGSLLQEGLRKLAQRFPCFAEVRGRGLMVGVEVVSPGGETDSRGHPRLDGALAREVKRACFARGLILETGGRHGAVLRFLPPLVVTEAELEQALNILAEAVQDALGRAAGGAGCHEVA